jgi:glutathione S-transferase
MGERFGSADILLTSCVVWALLCEIELPTTLGEYRHRVVSRTSFQAAMASNDPSSAMTDDAGGP